MNFVCANESTAARPAIRSASAHYGAGRYRSTEDTAGITAAALTWAPLATGAADAVVLSR
jgi:hypothetical protein